MKASDPRWNAFRNNVQTFTPPGYSTPLLSIYTVETHPWQLGSRNVGGVQWQGLTPPVCAGDYPGGYPGPAVSQAYGPYMTNSANLTCTYGPQNICMDVPTWTAWEAANMAQARRSARRPARTCARVPAATERGLAAALALARLTHGWQRRSTPHGALWLATTPSSPAPWRRTRWS